MLHSLKTNSLIDVVKYHEIVGRFVILRAPEEEKVRIRGLGLTTSWENAVMT
jgi:hypothetical protein